MTKCTDVAAKTIDLFVMYKLLKIKLQGKYILVLYFCNRIIIIIIKKLHHSHFVSHVKFSKNTHKCLSTSKLTCSSFGIYCKFIANLEFLGGFFCHACQLAVVIIQASLKVIVICRLKSLRGKFWHQIQRQCIFEGFHCTWCNMKLNLFAVHRRTLPSMHFIIFSIRLNSQITLLLMKPIKKLQVYCRLSLHIMFWALTDVLLSSTPFVIF